jgi:acyl-coenzyme A synthetase/AMP-(fatty) acid ligase
MLPNWHEAAVIYLASTLAGMVVNPILPSMRDRELRFILEDADSRVVFAPSLFGYYDYTSMLTRVTAQMESPPRVVVVRGDPSGDYIPFASLLETQAVARQLPALNPDAVRMILYTSGTTGRPKGVLHKHNSIHTLICQIRDHWFVEQVDRFLVASPIAHIGGSVYAFECPLLLGTTAVLMDHWNGDDAVKLMQAQRCAHGTDHPHRLPIRVTGDALRFRRINIEMTPHQRLGTVDDVASTVAFSCSPGGAFINGQTIVVDGGWSSTKYLSELALTSEWKAP